MSTETSELTTLLLSHKLAQADKRNGQSIIANSYGYGAVDCYGKFHHRSGYKVLEVLA